MSPARTAPRSRVAVACAALAALAPGSLSRGEERKLPETQPELLETKIDVRRFEIVESQSGSVNYYKVVDDPAEPFIRAAYRPPLETVTLGAEVPESLRGRIKKLRWRWRALVLPRGGNECRDGYGDSAAVVYVTFKRGLKWYSLKYVWSSEATQGEICDRHNNLFRGQDTIVLESGGPTGVWRTEVIDPAAEFRRHWEGGDPGADVPDMVGIGIMSDGDQTNSRSEADYAGFTLLH